MSLPAIIRSFDAAVSDSNVADRTITAKVNTNALDRFNSVLDPRGAKLENYRRSGVLLWEHGRDPRIGSDPIGKALWIKLDSPTNPTSIIAKYRFLADPFSDQRFQWYRNGVLDSFSVRAVPLSYRMPTREEIRARPELNNDRPNETRGQFDGPIIYDSWDVGEVSCTSVPGNTECVVIERALTLLDLADSGQLWIPEEARPMIEQQARVAVSVPRTATDSAGGLVGGGATIKPNEGPSVKRVIKEDPPGTWNVYSEEGKHLGGPYHSKGEAEKRLEQVDYFKHQHEEHEAERSAPHHRDPGYHAPGTTHHAPDGGPHPVSKEDDGMWYAHCSRCMGGPYPGAERAMSHRCSEVVRDAMDGDDGGEADGVEMSATRAADGETKPGKHKPTHGVKKRGGKFVVVANSGRLMGEYKSHKEASKRVQEIEYFKHAGRSAPETPADQSAHLDGKTPAEAAAGPYGYCPHCGAPGADRDGPNDRCENGHVYPSSAAKSRPGVDGEDRASPGTTPNLPESQANAFPRGDDDDDDNDGEAVGRSAPEDPVSFDGHGAWTVRALPGARFDDEATARAVLAELDRLRSAPPPTLSDVVRLELLRFRGWAADRRAEQMAHEDLYRRGVV